MEMEEPPPPSPPQVTEEMNTSTVLDLPTPPSPPPSTLVAKEKEEETTPQSPRNISPERTGEIIEKSILEHKKMEEHQLDPEKLARMKTYEKFKLGGAYREVMNDDEYDDQEVSIYKFYEGIADEKADEMIECALTYASTQMSKLFNSFASPSICIRSSSRKRCIIFHDKEKTARIHRDLCLMKANAAVEFSGPLISIPSHELFQVYGAVPMKTESFWQNFCVSPGGRAFYKKGTDKLLGAIGVSGDKPNLDEKIALHVIESMGYDTRPNISIVINEPHPHIEFDGRYYLYIASLKRNQKTFAKIYDKFEKKDLCEHKYENVKDYFSSRAESRNPDAICPKCFKTRII